jgi:hypothetical protein
LAHWASFTGNPLPLKQIEALPSKAAESNPTPLGNVPVNDNPFTGIPLMITVIFVNTRSSVHKGLIGASRIVDHENDIPVQFDGHSPRSAKGCQYIQHGAAELVAVPVLAYGRRRHRHEDGQDRERDHQFHQGKTDICRDALFRVASMDPFILQFTPHIPSPVIGSEVLLAVHVVQLKNSESTKWTCSLA